MFCCAWLAPAERDLPERTVRTARSSGYERIARQDGRAITKIGSALVGFGARQHA
jgi:hypothetical protein